MGPEGTKEDYEILRRALGFDRPLPEQYGLFLWRAVQGDFGRSLRHQQPTLPLVLQRFPATAVLAIAALLLATLLALPLGILAAVRRGSLLDSGAMVLALAGQCMPTFWLGILLILVFAVNLRWVPVYGGEGLLTLVLPAVTLGVWAMARTARITRSSMLEVPEPGLPPNGAGQGHRRVGGDPPARPPQRRDPHRDRARPRAG